MVKWLDGWMVKWLDGWIKFVNRSSPFPYCHFHISHFLTFSSSHLLLCLIQFDDAIPFRDAILIESINCEIICL
jgi:hypothetical protein